MFNLGYFLPSMTGILFWFANFINLSLKNLLNQRTMFRRGYPLIILPKRTMWADSIHLFDGPAFYMVFSKSFKLLNSCSVLQAKIFVITQAWYQISRKISKPKQSVKSTFIGRFPSMHWNQGADKSMSGSWSQPCIWERGSWRESLKTLGGSYVCPWKQGSMRVR